MKTSDIVPYEKNAKTHPQKQVELIAESIKQFGFNQPIVVDKNNICIVGHGRLAAAKLLGLEDVPVVKLENLTDDQVKAYRLADNKLNESPWDIDLAVAELKELPEDLFKLTGFDRDLLITDEEKDNKIPAIPKVVRTQPGDVYTLGKHRIMCGNSLDTESVDKLMGGNRARMIFTSPPYNINAKMYKTYKDNLKSREYIDFNLNIFREWEKYTEGLIFWNISYNRNSKTEFIDILYEITKTIPGIRFMDLVVWDKGHAMPVQSKDAMTRTYEDIYVFANDEETYKDNEMIAVYKNYQHAYYFKKKDKGLANYWRVVPNNTQTEEHKACYPVGLVVKGILIGTEEEDIIAEPFLGSGTNVIAAEKTGRACYGMEMDPAYVDVAVQRWVDYTGVTKVKKNGKIETWQMTKQN